MTEPVQITDAPAFEFPDGFTLSFDPCWFQAPRERSLAYFPAFARVSIVLQTMLRRAIPAIHLSEIEHFRDTRMIYPLLVYVASRPFPGEPKTEFTYDVVDRVLMRKFYNSVGHNLPIVLAEVWERLRAAGMADVAVHYRPSRASVIMATVIKLKVCRRRLEALLVSETLMVNQLLLFAGSATLEPKLRASIAAKCEKIWLSRLRRLFAKQDYTALGPDLMAAATEALKSGIQDYAQAA